MSDVAMIRELTGQILEAIARIERRFEGISVASDFSGAEGLDRLDGIGMMLISIGENTARLEKISSGEVFRKHTNINWRGIIGVRNIMAHDYFNIDPEEIFAICSKHIPELKKAVTAIYDECELSTNYM